MDEGIKAIAKHQKHIKVGDCSEYGWTMVQLYDNDALVLDSDNEKRLEKAEKEAERIVNKNHHGVVQLVEGEEGPGATRTQHKPARPPP